jgi:hypothetical protein
MLPLAAAKARVAALPRHCLKPALIANLQRGSASLQGSETTMSHHPNSDDSDTDGSAPADPKSDNNRSAPRRRVLKSGLVAFNQRHATLSCAVRDLSDTGALLRLSEVAHVPQRFELIIDLDGLEADCEVMWRRGRDIGVRFSAPPRKAAPRRSQSVAAAPAKLRFR